MSKKATNTSRAVTKVLSKTAAEARLASEAKCLTQDAVKAAIVAASAAGRANAAQGSGDKGTISAKGIARDARAAAEEAVERARDAIKAADGDDVVSAAHAANLAARAAQRTASLSAAISVLVGTSQAAASGKTPEAPSVTPERDRGETPRQRRERELASLVDRAANCLVAYNHRVIATFAREEDAFLLEAELAELDRESGVASATCEVLDRRTGKRLGGYMLTAGKLLVFLRDDEHDSRFGGRRH